MSKTNYIASMQGMPILADRAKKTESGVNIDSALGNKADNTPTFTEAATRVNLNGSNETMPTILGKVKKWFTDLKALAFKATVGTSDIDNDAITAAKVKDNETLPVSISGNAASTSSVAWANVSGKPSTYTPSAHADSTGSYGKGTTANYGHVKLLNGDLNGKPYTDGVAAASAHTHSQYLTSHQSISGKADKVSGSVSGRLAALDANGNLASSGILASEVAATVSAIGGKQDALPEDGEAEDTYAINISGTAGIHSYNFGVGSNYYKLADITFDDADLVYAGVQIAAQWRDNGNLTGSGIITISFSEYLHQAYEQGISGRVVVTFCRGDSSSFSGPGFIFFVKKNTNTSYTLYAKVGTYKAISFGLMSGCCTKFSAPDTLTTISYSSSDTKLPYFVPSGTTYTPQ